MPIPPFNPEGDLPVAIHPATLAEVLARFGVGSLRRQQVGAILSRIYHLVQTTSMLERFIVFGSFVTDKLEPNDVDIILVMRDDFDMWQYDAETQSIFDHQRAGARWNASIFWVCKSSLFRETLDDFLAHGQIKRDQTRRGIVEVAP